MQSGTDAIADGDFSIKYLRTGSKEVDKLVDVFNHMIDTLRTERTHMSEQSYFIQNLLDVTPTGIVIMDIDGMLSYVNPSAQKILEIPPIYEGKEITAFKSELISKITELEIEQSRMISINGVEKYKCQATDVIHQGFKRRFVLIDDLTNEILQSEKDAYGRIIRMMAHEVNNSMGAINSILDTVVEYGFKDDHEPELKSSLLMAMDRNTGLANFMDNYASILRLPSPSKYNLDLSKLLTRCGQLYIPAANEKDIAIEFDIPDQPIMLSADPILLEQAISNIIKNAIESIEEDGDIIIACTASPVGFSISDNGKGVSSEVAQKLFTPFFSTKTTGQGVGLILVRDILQSHDAKYTLKTDTDTKWTTFEVTF